MKKEEKLKQWMEIYRHSGGWELHAAEDDYLERIMEDMLSSDDEAASDDDGWYDDWEDPNEDDLEDHEAIAIRLMDALTENNLDSYILLKDPVIAEWWGNIVKARNYQAEKKRKAEEAQRKKEEDERARAELLSRLTPEERRLLGIK